MAFQKRGFTSLLLTFSFLAATISGLVLYVSPRGRTANASDWSMLGLSLYQWSAVHINTCLLVLIVAALHLYLNWTMFRGYVKKTLGGGFHFKQETLLAFLFAALFTGGACIDLQPFRAVTNVRYQFKNYWDRPAVIELGDEDEMQDLDASSDLFPSSSEEEE